MGYGSTVAQPVYSPRNHPPPMDPLSLLRGALGVLVLLGVAVLFSSDRKRIDWRLVLLGLLVQVALAVLVLYGRGLGEVFGPFAWPSLAFRGLSSLFVSLLGFTVEGARFVFGPLASAPPASESLGVILAFQVLPTIIFISSLMAILYHVGAMQLVVRGMAWIFGRATRASGPESLSLAANVFVGMIEAPLVIRPFLSTVTRSELLVIMTGGLATIAGGVMAAYIGILGDAYASTHALPVETARLDFAERLLAASFMAAPAALVFAKVLLPGAASAASARDLSVHVERTDANLLHAAARGASDGLRVALNVAALLVAFIALVALANAILGFLAGLFGYSLTFQQLLGWALAPIAWLIGVPAQDAILFGALVGTKIVLNEFVAYLGLAEVIASASMLPKSALMSTFALCGFANFASVALLVGGIGQLVPERTPELARLGMRALLAGTLANLMTATVAGAIVG